MTDDGLDGGININLI